jgi:hypothetical protein
MAAIQNDDDLERKVAFLLTQEILLLLGTADKLNGSGMGILTEQREEKQKPAWLRPLPVF